MTPEEQQSNLETYTWMIDFLEKARAENNGSLPQEVESAFVEILDRLWCRLSTKEQMEFESIILKECAPPDHEQW